MRRNSSQLHIDISDILCFLHYTLGKSMCRASRQASRVRFIQYCRRDRVVVLLRRIRVKSCSILVYAWKSCAECVTFPSPPVVQVSPCLSRALFIPPQGGRAMDLSLWSKVARQGCRTRNEVVRSAISHFDSHPPLLLPIGSLVVLPNAVGSPQILAKIMHG
jgi:hypothetical protein